ncbi:replication endonuclease [Sulfurimonas sp. SWIR-19]|uniref:replication endonuclease n=1 Tax=Sulfurimonas sp. SWIR-19 TaxID=2878390 RepID=UPI001CF11774|nr:replication endonuclease [Sulfurimonas sp. SWIR-19]UCN00058.1 replication endonuclease [Sulfurimonas sp. SWIR-19]
MKNYGLTSYQREYALKKLHNNLEFMNSNGVRIDNDVFVPYADFVQNSYNNSDRYIAEIQHRAWNMFDYARENELVNLMFTLTLPSVWHPMKRKYPNSKTDKIMIFNQQFGGRKYITKINGYKILNCNVVQRVGMVEPDLDFSPMDKYSPRNASKELSKMLKRFYMDRSYTSIDKKERCYFRVTEPHEDGTPHVHMSLFVPKDKQERIIKALKRLYPAPMGQIETDIRKPVHYLMKYVLKTFDDLREDKNISNLTLWYLYHGISRFYTSRTFVNLEIYRRLQGKYELKELTEAYRREEVNIYYYKDSDKIALIENEYGTLYVPKPVNWSEKIEHKDRLSEDGKTIQLDSGFESIYKEVPPKPIEVVIDGKEYMTYNFKLKEHNVGNAKLKELGIEPVPLTDILIVQRKKPYQMNDYELYQYFQGLDIDTVDDKHYLYTRNLLIERGYDVGEWLKLTAIEELQEEIESEVF